MLLRRTLPVRGRGTRPCGTRLGCGKDTFVLVVVVLCVVDLYLDDYLLDSGWQEEMRLEIEGNVVKNTKLQVQATNIHPPRCPSSFSVKNDIALRLEHRDESRQIMSYRIQRNVYATNTPPSTALSGNTHS